MPRSNNRTATILQYQVKGDLVRSHITGAQKQEQRLRAKGPRQSLVLHFIGTPTQIRSCERWELRSLGRTEQDGRIYHGFECQPSVKPVTANAFRLDGKKVSFYRRAARNENPNHGVHCRAAPQPVRV
jgi:hypothetical protein